MLIRNCEWRGPLWKKKLITSRVSFGQTCSTTHPGKRMCTIRHPYQVDSQKLSPPAATRPISPY